ncbi:hypothetical protein [Rubricoccus marinus]|uniref:hypothetical protein n=1 Tax=Rubricoccus marinus TaxID=716817 RepID=UPI00117B4E01|nr:hypothetical protein [Rubricoccus marinus]
MRLIVAGEVDPYDAGWRIWGQAFGHAAEYPDIMWPTWLIWGALTDRVEVRPEETEQAYEAIRRAAREWLLLPDDPSAQEAYFQRWVYEELGYERPEDASPAS